MPRQFLAIDQERQTEGEAVLSSGHVYSNMKEERVVERPFQNTIVGRRMTTTPGWLSSRSPAGTHFCGLPRILREIRS